MLCKFGERAGNLSANFYPNFNLVFYISQSFEIKQLFYSRLLGMR